LQAELKFYEVQVMLNFISKKTPFLFVFQAMLLFNGQSWGPQLELECCFQCCLEDLKQQKPLSIFSEKSPFRRALFV